jgi:hypothetical protein
MYANIHSYERKIVMANFNNSKPIIIVKKGDLYIVNLKEIMLFHNKIELNGKVIEKNFRNNMSDCVLNSMPKIYSLKDVSNISYYINKEDERITMTRDNFNSLYQNYEWNIDNATNNGNTEEEIENTILLRNLKSNFVAHMEHTVEKKELDIVVIPYVEDIPFIIMDRDLTGNFFSSLGEYSEASHCISYFEKHLKEDGFVFDKEKNHGFHYYDFTSNHNDPYVSFTFPGKIHNKIKVFAKRKNTVDTLVALKEKNESEWNKLYTTFKRNYGQVLSGVQINSFLAEIKDAYSYGISLSGKTVKDREARQKILQKLRSIINKLEGEEEIND